MSRRGRGGAPVSLFAFQDIITSVTGIMILVTLMLGLEIIRRRQGSPEHQTRVLTEEIRQAAAQAVKVQATVADNRRQIEQLRASLQGQDVRLLEDARIDSAQLARQLADLQALNELLQKELADSDSRRRAAQQSLTDLQSQDASRDDDRKSLEQLTADAQRKLAELQQLRAANRVIFNPGQSDAKKPWLVELTAQGVLAAEVGKAVPPVTFPTVQEFVGWAAKRSRSSEYFVLLVKPSTIKEFDAGRAALEKQGFDVGFDLLKDDQTAIDSQLGAAAP